MSLNDEQPPPLDGTAPATWDLVLADMRERDKVGAMKYRVRHQYDNGRDHLVDAYQEALDLCVYLRAEIERRKVEQAAAQELEFELRKEVAGLHRDIAALDHRVTCLDGESPEGSVI